MRHAEQALTVVARSWRAKRSEDGRGKRVGRLVLAERDAARAGTVNEVGPAGAT